jgi:hypothetical protein
MCDPKAKCKCEVYREYQSEVDDLKRRADRRPDLEGKYFAVIFEMRRIAHRHARGCNICLAETSGEAA